MGSEQLKLLETGTSDMMECLLKYKSGHETDRIREEEWPRRNWGKMIGKENVQYMLYAILKLLNILFF